MRIWLYRGKLFLAPPPPTGSSLGWGGVVLYYNSGRARGLQQDSNSLGCVLSVGDSENKVAGGRDAVNPVQRVLGTQRSGNLKQLSCNQSRRFCTKRRGFENVGARWQQAA